MKRSTRREFVAAALSAAAAALVPAAVASESSRRERLLVTKLVNLVPDPFAAEKFGLKYLKREPGEARVATLVKLICGDRRSDFENLPPSQRKALLQERYHVEFKRGDIVDLMGWQFARTECRLFALATLANQME
jgi:hypothetical protein